MADQWITVSIVILLIMLGAFLERLLLWWEHTRFHLEPREAREQRERVLAERRAQQIEEWVQLGQQRQILSQNLQGPVSHQDLLSWLAEAPLNQVTAAGTLSADERTRLTRWFWAVFAYLVILGTVSGWFTLSATTLSVFAFLAAGLFGSCVAFVSRQAGKWI